MFVLSFWFPCCQEDNGFTRDAFRGLKWTINNRIMNPNVSFKYLQKAYWFILRVAVYLGDVYQELLVYSISPCESSRRITLAVIESICSLSYTRHCVVFSDTKKAADVFSLSYQMILLRAKMWVYLGSQYQWSDRWIINASFPLFNGSIWLMP